MGKWAALVSVAHSARFSISGRHSAIENGRNAGQLAAEQGHQMLITRRVEMFHAFPYFV